MPSDEAFVALQVIGAVAALAAAFRRWPRLAFAVAWLCLLVLAGLRGSRGKVVHNDLLLLWAAAPFLLAPVVHDVRELVARRRYGWPIRTAIVITALIYFFAGLHKLRRSGIDWVFGDQHAIPDVVGAEHRRAEMGRACHLGGRDCPDCQGRAFILGFEITFLVVLVVHRLRFLYALGALFLHTMTWFVLGLDYWAWALTVPLLLIDWPEVVERARARGGGRSVPAAS